MNIFRVDLLKTLKKGDMKALKELINTVNIIKLIHVFKQLSSKDQAVVFKHLNKDRALQVLSSLEREKQSQLLRHLSQSKIIKPLIQDKAVENIDIKLQNVYKRTPKCNFIKYVSIFFTKFIRISI